MAIPASSSSHDNDFEAMERGEIVNIAQLLDKTHEAVSGLRERGA
jgi:hypothetical protein